jgi:hypothetical protein
MTGKTLRATLLAGSMLSMTLGMGMLTTPSDQSHFSHVLGGMLLMVGAVLAFVREQIKEEQLARIFEPRGSETQKHEMQDRLTKCQDARRTAYLEKKMFPPEK